MCLHCILHTYLRATKKKKTQQEEEKHNTVRFIDEDNQKQQQALLSTIAPTKPAGTQNCFVTNDTQMTHSP